jgi:hypothetical protein
VRGYFTQKSVRLRNQHCPPRRLESLACLSPFPVKIHEEIAAAISERKRKPLSRDSLTVSAFPHPRIRQSCKRSSRRPIYSSIGLSVRSQFRGNNASYRQDSPLGHGPSYRGRPGTAGMISGTRVAMVSPSGDNESAPNGVIDLQPRCLRWRIK